MKKNSYERKHSVGWANIPLDISSSVKHSDTWKEKNSWEFVWKDTEAPTVYKQATPKKQDRCLHTDHKFNTARQD